MARNSTIIVKKKNLKCGCYDYNFSKGRCKMHATQEDSKKRIDAHEEQETDESVQNLIQDLDAIFSKFIRLKYADEKGIVGCFTCNNTAPIGQMQNGHFISRSHMATRFYEPNCRPQCPICNSNHETNTRPFHDRLEAEERGITQELTEMAREVVKPTRDELKQLIISYRWKVKLLEKKIKRI